MANPNKKKPTPPAPEPTEEEIENEDLDKNLQLTSQSLEQQAQEKLSPTMVKVLKKIAYYTAKVGLPLNEACLLVNIDINQLQEEMKLEPLIEKIIKIKELEYKKDLLHTISQKARSGDDKLAQWLLSKKYPEEYGDTKKMPQGGDSDIIFEAIQFIRRNGDANPLVSEASGRALIVKKTSASKGVYERIGDIFGQETIPGKLIDTKPTQDGRGDNT